MHFLPIHAYIRLASWARARAITGWKRSLRGTRSGWLLVRTKSFAPERELAAGQQTAGSNRPATVIYVREAARMHLWTHTSVRARANERVNACTRTGTRARSQIGYSACTLQQWFLSERHDATRRVDRQDGGEEEGERNHGERILSLGIGCETDSWPDVDELMTNICNGNCE